MHYLVTGGCGFIGSHLVTALLAHGHRVTALDDLSTGSLDTLPAGATFVKGNILDETLVSRVLTDGTEGIDGCFHLAAIPSVERCINEWQTISQVNVMGTISVFEACRKLPKPVPVVYASSAATYGPHDGVLTEDETPMKPASSYGVDKLACEYYAHVAWQNYNLPSMGLRFFNVYGPGQPKRSPYSGVITCFMHAHEQGLPFTINGDGLQTRDFIYVGDIAAACIAAMQVKNMQAGVVNVCTGKATSVLDIAHHMANIYGGSMNVTYQEARVGDVKHSLGSSKRMKQWLVDLAMPTPLGEGLALTLGV